jgi:condensin complex subunit 3
MVALLTCWQNLAEENLTLFLHCFTKGHPALQTIALQIIADILITHPSLLAEPSIDATTTTEQPETNQMVKPVLKVFSKALKSDDPGVQSTGAMALSKTMLSRLITDPDLLKQLVVAYFDPDTNTNAQLKQSLSYFLPVYCHSRAENAHRMVYIASSVIARLVTIRENLLDDADIEDESGEGMVKLGTVGQMILDWTDPRKIVGFAEAAGNTATADGAGETQFLLVERLLDRMNSNQISKEEKKVLFAILGKVHLPAGSCSPDLLKECCQEVAVAYESGLATDTTSRNILKKLQTQLFEQMNSIAAAERGGGGPDETVVETTELPTEADISELPTEVGAEAVETEADITVTLSDGQQQEDVDDDDSDVTEVQQTLKDTTLGATGFGQTTIGAPDAEGTRVQLDDEGDTEMTDDFTEV